MLAWQTLFTVASQVA